MKQLSTLVCVILLQTICIAQLAINIVPVGQITEQFYSDLAEYSNNNGNNLLRADFLDRAAVSRLRYFCELLQENGKQHSLFDLTDSIPKNDSGHSRFYNKPSLFKEPIGIIYPEPLPILLSEKTKICAEIMQQTSWKKTSGTLYNIEKLVEMAVNAFNNQLGLNFIMNGYRGSKSHKKAIDDYGRGLIGTATFAIVSIKKNKIETKWSYEVIIYNLTVFSKKLIS